MPFSFCSSLVSWVPIYMLFQKANCMNQDDRYVEQIGLSLYFGNMSTQPFGNLCIYVY